MKRRDEMIAARREVAGCPPPEPGCAYAYTPNGPLQVPCYSEPKHGLVITGKVRAARGVPPYVVTDLSTGYAAAYCETLKRAGQCIDAVPADAHRAAIAGHATADDIDALIKWRSTWCELSRRMAEWELLV